MYLDIEILGQVGNSENYLFQGDNFEANISTPIKQTEIKPMGRRIHIL